MPQEYVRSKHFSPKLTRSPFEFRIKLAEKRLNSYPLDSLDYVMNDMEHPVDRFRHACQCTTDLTGRTLEFISTAHSVLDGQDDTFLNALFHRMMLKGEFAGLTRRCFPYYLYSNDPEAFNYIKKQFDRWVTDYMPLPEEERKAQIKKWLTIEHTYSNFIEPLGRMYELTGKKEYLALSKTFAELHLVPFFHSHSHSLMTVLRSMLFNSIVSGDMSFAEQVRPYREEIKKAQMADGAISEGFPRSYRNEGCSIADWIILNLRWFDLFHEEEALDIAEHSLLNGMFFDQFITGGFGHRNFEENGYSTEIEEAWWCCTQTCGLAICEFAKHAVELYQGEIHIRFLVPGVYRLNDNGREIAVTITSEYPATYSAVVRVIGADEIPVRFRMPYYAKNLSVTSHAIEEGVSYYLESDIGHYIEKRPDGYVVKYGALMLAPMIYSDRAYNRDTKDMSIPDGYVREEIDKHLTMYPVAPDQKGFLPIAAGTNLPVWMVYDDGTGSHTGTMNRATAYMEVCNSKGFHQSLCFHPMCYATSNLTLCHTPIVFDLDAEYLKKYPVIERKF